VKSEKTFISFLFEAKQKIRSKTKICLKRNKAKIRFINFALVGSEKKWKKGLQNGSHFASFRFEATNFFCKTGAPNVYVQYVCVCDSAKFKNKLMGVMVYF
jgi:hypothetical protein